MTRAGAQERGWAGERGPSRPRHTNDHRARVWRRGDPDAAPAVGLSRTGTGLATAHEGARKCVASRLP